MDLKIPLLNFNFAMIYIIHKILALLKSHLIILNIAFSNAFLKIIIDFYYFQKKIFFFPFYIMMENPRPEKENTIRDIGNRFRLKKETKAIKDRILRDVKNLFEDKDEENYHKPVRVSNFWSNNYIEYKSNEGRDKTVSVEKYLNKIGPYLKDIIYNLKKSDTRKIQLTITNNFISPKDKDEQRVMHSKSDNIEVMINY